MPDPQARILQRLDERIEELILVRQLALREPMTDENLMRAAKAMAKHGDQFMEEIQEAAHA